MEKKGFFSHLQRLAQQKAANEIASKNSLTGQWRDLSILTRFLMAFGLIKSFSIDGKTGAPITPVIRPAPKLTVINMPV